MGITPHSIISTKHQKWRGCSPRGCRIILNKLEGWMLYQKTRNIRLLIPRTLRTFVKRPGPTRVTPTMILWLLPAHDSTHDLYNAKQMAKKNEYLLENRLGHSLPPDTCKCDNRVNMHCNSLRDSLYLSEVNLWRHTRTSRENDC